MKLVGARLGLWRLKKEEVRSSEKIKGISVTHLTAYVIGNYDYVLGYLDRNGRRDRNGSKKKKNR